MTYFLDETCIAHLPYLLEDWASRTHYHQHLLVCMTYSYNKHKTSKLLVRCLFIGLQLMFFCEAATAYTKVEFQSYSFVAYMTMFTHMFEVGKHKILLSEILKAIAIKIMPLIGT